MKADKSIIPLRFRIMDEDGEYQQYTVKGYKPILLSETKTTLDGIYVTSSAQIFECRVIINNKVNTVRLYYLPDKQEWLLAI